MDDNKSLEPLPGKNFSHIRNKKRRESQYREYKHARAVRKSDIRRARAKGEEKNPELREERLAKNVTKTLENTRELDDTYVDDEDAEVEADVDQDEFAEHYNGDQSAKILITTSRVSTQLTLAFGANLENVLPRSQFIRRKHKFHIRQIIQFCNNRDYTDIVVINEDKKKPVSLTVIHLPEGPTAHFALSSVTLMKDIAHQARPTQYFPELVLNNFNTRLGHSVGRMLGSLFPQLPQFEGRNVVTFHNQRDFIFFRRHRYEFQSKDKVNLQEVGPRFTLKLRWLQRGLFDPSSGDYEWIFKTEMEASRRKFFL
ncbi:Ribosome production factor 1 [Dimargaris xerosporica]|nr:Ribosome production factor 1 [Dimargaris xerosporica]